ncbi:MAG: rod shape-determining protein MreD [Gammaproteobacteria bacterium]
MSAAPRLPSWSVLLSLLVALSLEVTPLPGDLAAWRPPWLALTMIYWALAYPRRYGLALAWFAGLVLDILKGGVLGQHALAMTVATWLTLHLHLRLRLFPIWQQTMAIGALVAAHQFLLFWVDGMTAGAELSWERTAPTLAAMLAWPILVAVLDGLRGRFRALI